MVFTIQDSPWTDERIDLLTTLWNNKVTASGIARTMGGVTKNGIIGKARRLGLARRKASSVPPKPVKKRKSPVAKSKAPAKDPKVKVYTPGRHTAHLPSASKDLPAPTPPKSWDDSKISPEAERMTLMELTEHSCRWPIGDPTTADFKFCGQRRGSLNTSYCKPHYKRSFNISPPRVRAR